MASAYTPGLTVSADTVVRKVRRLPLKGEVLVAVGAEVAPDTVVARTDLPGPLSTVRVGEKLSVEPQHLDRVLKVAEGQAVTAGEVLAETKAFFGLYTARCTAPVDGTVEYISQLTGNLGVRHPPRRVEVPAYIRGHIVEVLPGDGAIVESRGAFVQGIFGVGGERQGMLHCLVEDPAAIAPPDAIDEIHHGGVVVSGAGVTAAHYARAAEVGAVAIVAAAVRDADLREILGYDVGVAITGDEKIPVTLIVTEGFGELAMAHATFELLRRLDGASASVSGATQIRAGVIRPEIIAPHSELRPDGGAAPEAELSLAPGARIRLIREPYFGLLATVRTLPPEPQKIDTGAVVRILTAETDDGRTVTVPRANVEIIAI